MANKSIKDSFQRFWQHCVSSFATKEYVDNAVGSGGASGGGIIDVTELPTTNIDENALYRVPLATLYYRGIAQGITYSVNGLPSTGEPCTTDGKSVATTYYNTVDNTLYGYVPSAVGSVLGVPAGWYPAGTLLGALGSAYGGIVFSKSDMENKGTFYLLVQRPLYFYKDGKWRDVVTEETLVSLKTKLFTSWDDALLFCRNRDIYEIEVLGLTIITEDNSYTSSYFCKNIRCSSDNLTMEAVSSMTTDSSHKLTYKFDYDTSNNTYVPIFKSDFSHVEHYNAAENKLTIKKIINAYGSAVAEAIVKYFA